MKITRRVYETISKESLRCSSTETVGTLIGTSNCPIALEATLPGKNAELGFAHVKNDTEWDNLMLRDAIQRYQGKVKLIGFWHKHPGDMYYPSTIDLQQAQSLTKDIGDNKPLYFIISNVVNGNVKLYGYSLAYPQHQFKQVKLEIIEDNAQEVKNALENEPVIAQTKDTDFWSDTKFQFYFTKTGQFRIKQEVRELESAGYAVRVLRRETDNRLVLDIKKETYLFLLFLRWNIHSERQEFLISRIMK